MAEYPYMHICRDCMNRRYHLNLDRKECYYLDSPAQCKICGQVRKIVVDIKVTAKIKKWFRDRFSKDKYGG